jgi:DNA-binding CsgD family transcriptional regulator
VKLAEVDEDRRAGTPVTPRELQVLELVLRGGGNKQIAATLGMSEQGVKEHVSSLLQKFVVPNRAALAEAGARLEFSGERGVDRSWMRGLFLDAQPQISIARGPELRFEAANEAFMEAVGRRPVIGRTVREAFPELEGQGVIETGERVYATGVPVVEHAVERSWDRGKGVERRIIDLVIQPLHDESGAVNGVVSFAVDVTELVRDGDHASLALAELEPILQLNPTAALVIDVSGHVIAMNDQARDLELRLARWDMPIARALGGLAVVDEPYAFIVGDPPRTSVLRASARPLRDPKGAILGAIVVLRALSGDKPPAAYRS